MRLRCDRFFSANNPLPYIKLWLESLSVKYPDFSFTYEQVLSCLNTNKFEQEIFPGVFVMPIGETKAEDLKLVPLKLIKIKPGAVIPLHQHGGSEYYQLLPGSNLLDTRGRYTESNGCVSHINEIHAVTNIDVKDAFALIALPTELKLAFLNEKDSYSYLNTKIKDMPLDEKHEPHNLFIRFLLVKMLLKSNKERALALLSELDLKQIQTPMQICIEKMLERELLAEELAKVVTLDQLRSKLSARPLN